jgi:hypothetical protein
MKNIFPSLMIGTALAVSMSAIAITPAQATSLTNISIGGSNPDDFDVFDSDGTNTFRVENPTIDDVVRVLQGNAADPQGNVKLGINNLLPDFDFTKNTTLEGTINGESLVLSSLTIDDWINPYQGSATFAEFWFEQAFTANGLGALIGTPTGDALFAGFVNNNGFLRFSDPNISYVNFDADDNLIRIGKAGFLDASGLIQEGVPDQFKPLLDNTTIQASQIVKYTYNGVTDYLFSFNATPTGLTLIGLNSEAHSGNYEVTLAAVAVPPTTTVPEPSVMLGLLGVAGILGAKRQWKKTV